MNRRQGPGIFDHVVDDRHVIDPNTHGIADLSEADLIGMGIFPGAEDPPDEAAPATAIDLAIAPAPIGVAAAQAEAAEAAPTDQEEMAAPGPGEEQADQQPGASVIRLKIDSTWPNDRKRADRLWRLYDGRPQDYVCATTKVIAREDLISKQLGRRFNAKLLLAYAKQAQATKRRDMADEKLASAAAAAVDYLRTLVVTEQDFERFKSALK
jgi:hypothetical protein